MVDRDVIEAIRERTDLVEVVSQVVTLQRRGTSFVGLCPFHDEKSPSFNVVPHKSIFHCFGCGASGDVFTFVMQARGLEFFEALKELGAACGVPVEDRALSPDQRRKLRARADLHDVCEAAAQFFHGVLMTRPEGAPAREYLERRGITPETVREYRLGFAPDRWSGLLDHLHREGLPPELAVRAGLARERASGRGAYDLFRARLVIPILDGRGRTVAFGGRIMGGQTETAGADAPKYVNSPETEIYRKSHVLYGLWHARTAIQRRQRALVVEGYFDVLSLHQAGYREAVATCGTALTAEHLAQLRKLTHKVVAQFDADEAGMRAATKSLSMFFQADIEPCRLQLGEHKDPDEFVQAEGSEAFEALLERSEPLLDLVLQRALRQHGRSPQGIQRVVDELAPMIRQVEAGSAQRLAMEQRVASARGIDERIVNHHVGHGRPPRPPGGEAHRWRGNRKLNQLFLYLIHAREEVLEVFGEVEDPGIVSERETVLQAISLLMEGRSVLEVVEEVGDPDLGRVLMAAAAREQLVDRERAAAGARSVLATLELRSISTRLSALQSEERAAEARGDMASYLALVREKAALSKRKAFLGGLPGVG